MSVKNLGAILDPTAPDDRPLIIQLSRSSSRSGAISHRIVILNRVQPLV
jgi:hypothetical protein